MDAKNPNKEFRTTPEYAEYQRDNFWADNEGKVPPFNTREWCDSLASMLEFDLALRPR